MVQELLLIRTGNNCIYFGSVCSADISSYILVWGVGGLTLVCGPGWLRGFLIVRLSKLAWRQHHCQLLKLHGRGRTHLRAERYGNRALGKCVALLRDEIPASLI